MPLFIRDRDVKFFNVVSQELVDYIIDSPIIVYKIDVTNTESNLYGESPNGKFYSKRILLTCMISHGDQVTETEEFGPTILQTVTFAFQRERIKVLDYYPENGDIIEWNNSFFEISGVIENQLLGSQFYNNFSIITNAQMVSRDKLNLEHLRPGDSGRRD